MMSFPRQVACAFCLVSITAVAEAQSVITTMRLGRDQIAVVKTAVGITTRFVFSEQVNEIICGDLYDPETGKGGFVVQRVENDVFLKPVVPKAVSNLFVKAGENREHTYSFDLIVVPSAQAFRIVNVISAEPPSVVEKKHAGEGGLAATATKGPSKADTADDSADSQAGTPASKPPASQPKVSSGSDKPKADISRSDNSSEGVLWREVTKRVVADYPQSAREANAQGEVVVEVTIDENGRVIWAQATSGPSDLRGAAVKAAYCWEFSKVKESNAPKEDHANITFSFQSADGKVQSYWSSIARPTLVERRN